MARRGEFDVTGWEERTLIERQPGRLGRATVTQGVSGAIRGSMPAHGSQATYRLDHVLC